MAILGQQNSGVYRTENVFTASGGNTTFTCKYDPTAIEVYKSGLRLVPSQFVATDGNTVSIPSVIDGNVVHIIGYKTQIHLAPFSNAPILVSTDQTLVTNQTYILTASASLTLPPAPLPGWAIRVINASGTVTGSILANGERIQGDVNDITIDVLSSTITLTYLDNVRGWWIF
jgi:hypothetical protein